MVCVRYVGRRARHGNGSWIAPGTSWIWEGGRVTDVGNARARIALLTGGRGFGLAGVVLLPDELHVLGAGGGACYVMVRSGTRTATKQVQTPRRMRWQPM